MEDLEIVVSAEISPWRMNFTQYSVVMLASGEWETIVADKTQPDGKNIGRISLDREEVYGTGFAHLSTKSGNGIWPLPANKDNEQVSKLEIAIVESAAIGYGKEYAASKLGRIGGSATSKRKAAASRRNGRKGGRPAGALKGIRK